MSFSPLSLVLAAVVALLLAVLVRRTHRRHAEAQALRDASERALKHATDLSGLTAALARAQTGADVIRAALGELLHAFEASAGAVIVVSEDGPAASIAHAVGYDVALLAAPLDVEDAARTPIAKSIRRRELVIVGSRAERDNSFPQATAEDFLARHEGAAVLPLVAGDRTLGAIALSFTQPRTFDGDEYALMVATGRHVAVALARARVYEWAERSRAEGAAFRVRADAELRERQRAEEALRESESKYRALAARTARLYELSAALSEAITVDAVAKVIIRHGRVVVGASAGSVTMLTDGGQQFETLYAEAYTRQVVEAWHRFPADAGLCSTAAATTGEPVYVPSLTEWQNLYPRSAALAADGGYASAAVLPLLAEGAVLGILSFHFTAPINFVDDYTAMLRSVAQLCAQALDRAHLYEAAQRARADAESANRAKDDFLSTLSHELRTPLTAILGWASMLRTGTVDASRTTRALDAIFSNATRQAQLIEDLLDVSRIVAGRASFDIEEFEIGDSARGAIEAIMPLAEAKGVELRVGDIPAVAVKADCRRLEQVCLNLLANAVKFTPPGGSITVAADVSDGSVHLRVADTGAGIDPEFLPSVFERFRQGDSTQARRVGGLGLGLFIARHLVEAQGGTIRVDSEGVGRGTVFIVSLPLADAGVTPRSPALDSGRSPIGAGGESGPMLTGVRVLLVDDEADAREVMASALETRGATVTAAASARDAIETLTHADFDVLLADIAMPERDGYELIRDIRLMPAARAARIPAAAVTACASVTDRERALAAGFQMHVAKPIPPGALAQTVATLARTSV
jgi:signal transduction histidine kinase/BarA-like signal transduction histidine kinase